MPTLGLVVAQFYEEIAEVMESTAKARATDRDATIAATIRVPGVFDTSLAADRLARQPDIDAVVVLGAVVTGDTDHDQVIAHGTASALTEVERERDTPVAFGVVGPGMSRSEAFERIEMAAGAVDSAVDTLDALPATDRRQPR